MAAGEARQRHEVDVVPEADPRRKRLFQHDLAVADHRRWLPGDAVVEIEVQFPLSRICAKRRAHRRFIRAVVSGVRQVREPQRPLASVQKRCGNCLCRLARKLPDFRRVRRVDVALPRRE